MLLGLAGESNRRSYLLAALTTPLARWEGELSLHLPTGRRLWTNAYIRPVVDDAGTVYALQLIAHDITARRAAEACANVDCLTGVASRKRLTDVLTRLLEQAPRAAAPLSVALFDVDRFKAVNDRVGHAGGDRALMSIAGTTAARIRATDYLGRWGGEEFLVICPATCLDGVHDLAERLRLAVAELDFESIGPPSCSFGVAQLAPGETAEELIARADAALYRAKRGGRNRVEREFGPLGVVIQSSAA